VAARGIHVHDIAHVINYDLPEVAENFIHRVGRTGRAGETGLASTLFVKEQRTDLFQLERALGIRIERIPVKGQSRETTARTHRETTERRQRSAPERGSAAPGPRIVALPGEFLQAQLEG